MQKCKSKQPQWYVLALPLLVLLLVTTGNLRAQDHDLVLQPAFDITSTDTSHPEFWKSPDIKLGSDFGDTFPPDIVRRGVTNPIYAKVYINGVDDYLLSSGDAKIRFHYRDATLGVAPPDLSDSSWQLIGDLPITRAGSDPPFLMGLFWPDSFTPTANYINWPVPPTGDYFHIRAEAMYPTTMSDVNPDDNVVFSMYESILGVRDVDLVVLIDVSGSMLTYQYNGTSYIDHVRNRVMPFVLSMTGSHRFAVVAFGGCLTGGHADIWPTPVASIQPATWANKVNAVNRINADVTVPSGGCMTPMGEGVQRAIDILTATPAGDHKRTILLLSDGYENQGTPRACTGSYTDPDPCISGTILSQLQTNDIRVFSIALGASAWTNCLECLADESGGEWYEPPDPGLHLGEAYLDMQQAYSADDLYRIDYGVSGGGDDTYGIYFEGIDKVLYFILEWEKLGNELNLEIRPPGGKWTLAADLPNTKFNFGDGYMVARVEKPKKGQWEYRVIGPEGDNYFVAVRSDKVGARLEMDIKASKMVGDDIYIKAHLADKGIVVKDARVLAHVQVPARVSFANVIRAASRQYIARYKKFPLNPDQVKEFKDNSPLSIALRTLFGDKVEKIKATRTVTVPLHLDKKGFYSGVLTGKYTAVASDYKITVKCEGETFHRTFTRTVRIKPGKILHEKSFAEILPVVDGRVTAWYLRVNLVDRFGNAITDARLMDKIEAEIYGIEKLNPFKPGFDCVFQQKLTVKKGVKPVLKRVTIGGKDIVVKRVFRKEDAK